jgi:hypothetical protein
MKKCLKPVTIREKKIKTIMKYCFIPLKMAIIEKSKDKCWQRCGKAGNLCTFSVGKKLM